MKVENFMYELDLDALKQLSEVVNNKDQLKQPYCSGMLGIQRMRHNDNLKDVKRLGSKILELSILIKRSRKQWDELSESLLVNIQMGNKRIKFDNGTFIETSVLLDTCNKMSGIYVFYKNDPQAVEDQIKKLKEELKIEASKLENIN